MSGEAILVTGAAGFVGSHLLELLAAERALLAGWYRPDTRPPAALAGLPVEWTGVDLLDRDAVRAAVAALRPAAIYHCAAAAHVGQSFVRTGPTFEVNVRGTHHLLEAVRVARLDARILIPGSAHVYRPAADPLGEGHPLGPGSPYALSKLAQEMLGRRAHAGDGQAVLLPRAFNHTGPRQNPSFAAPGFARQLALAEAGRAEPVLHVGNLDASRDLTDVRDVARAYRRLMRDGRPGRIYNVCSGRAYAIREILDGLLERVRIEVTVRADPARLRPVDFPRLVGDPSRIETEVGWRAEIPLGRTLDDLLEYWRRAVREAA